jgi:hypothetical protein
MPHIGENALLVPAKALASAVTVGASPFAYTMPSDGFVLITAGTVSLVEYGRQAVFNTVGIITGQVVAKVGDQIRVTYSVLPTMKFIPD